MANIEDEMGRRRPFGYLLNITLGLIFNEYTIVVFLEFWNSIQFIIKTS